MMEILTTAADAAKAASFFEHADLYFAKSMTLIGGFSAMALSAVGAAYGAGRACCAAIGAWKKCYAQNKRAPFQLLVFCGAPLSQVIYGMILMFVIISNTTSDPKLHAAWPVYLIVGVSAGIAMGISAFWQGTGGAAASDAFSESGKGFTNQLMALGIIETVAIFIMAFAIVLLGSVPVAA